MLFDSLESKKKASDPKEDVGKLSKLAIFILTINTILICLCLALFLKSTLNMINWDASGISFDVQKSQLHIAMYLFTLLIGYKYAFATISRRENSNISWFFMVYTPFIVFAVSVCGLENSQNELIQNILFYLLISIWLINFLYLHISQFFQTIKMEIEFLLEMIVDRRMHSFFLSLCYCVCLMMAFVNIITVYSENWFVFEYKFCQGTTNKGLTMLPKLSRIAPEKLLLNVQNILSIITLFTIFFGIIFAVFERKYINFRKLHFWISFMLCAVNCCVFQGLVFLKDILDNMEANGFANIVYVKANLENYESCCIMLIIALVADVIACLHSPACYNVTYKPVRNPDFTALPQKEVVSKELVDIVCINKEIRRLQKKDQHFKSSFIPLFIYFLFYIAIMVYLFNKAHSEDWLNIVINNNNHYVFEFNKNRKINLSKIKRTKWTI
ncbi:hypothetical protein MHBO_001092 [Bonamia ostreae]|uniref:Uncharacterized protein n=1 Tax=Bonamia ostreae TaxID=126728 RepID=A0ABV2AHR3_9EUKA